MKLGAQFYSIRDRVQTPEGIREAFTAMKEYGYTVTQMSGIGAIEAEMLKSYVDEFNLPIVCTHINPDFLLEDTDKYIREHKIYGCPVIGIGSMPTRYRGSTEGVRTFIKDFSNVEKKISDAGLKFAYHNHAFEFEDIGGVMGYDILIEEFPSLNFILDTYWVKYGGQCYLDYIKRIGAERMSNVHFKDMLNEPKGPICPCGVGVIDFAPVVELCDSLGIPNALVEQDNAPETNDSFGQMKISCDNLKKYFA